MVCSLTGTAAPGSLGFRSVGRVGRSLFLVEPLPREAGALLDERLVLEATDELRARRGVDRRGVVAAGMVDGYDRRAAMSSDDEDYRAFRSL